jgi:branched-chain amino acid transport system permease protein
MRSLRYFTPLLAAALIVALLAAGPIMSRSSPYMLHLLILCFISIVMVQGLNLLSGYVGDLNLGYGAFVGLGVYTTALLTLRGVSPWLGLLAAIGVSLLYGWATGLLVMRLRGSYFIMVTFALQMLLYEVALSWTSLTRGSMGLINLPNPGLFGLQFDNKLAWYFLALAAMAVAVVFCYFLAHSAIGEAWACTRQNRVLAESVGIHCVRYNKIAYLAGAVLAALGGWLLAHYLTLAAPDTLGLGHVIGLILMMAIGGRATIVGPILGAVLITLLPEQLRVLDDWRMSIYGLILVVISIFLPLGIMQFLKPAGSFFKGLRGPAQEREVG